MKNIQEIAIKLFDMVLPIRNQNEKCESVLLVYPGLIGDTFMFFNTLLEYTEYYSKKKIKVDLIVNNASKEVIKIVIPDIIEKISIYSIDEKKMMSDFCYHRNIIDCFRGYTYLKVVYHYSRYIPWAISIVASVNAEKKIYVDGNPHLTRYRTIMLKRCGERIYIDPMMTETEKNAEIIRSTINPFYKASSLRIKQEICNERLISNKYVLLAIGSSTYKKKWNTYKFQQLIQYLLDKYSFDIAVTGGKEDISEWEEASCLTNKRVHNYIGKTSLKEWIFLIQKSELVIGNDSAAIHIAFSANIQAICILGGIDRSLVFPYYFDVTKKDDKPTIIVEHQMDCVNCSYHGGPKKKNARCWNNINRGRQYECISEISVENVEDVVDDFYNKFLVTEN